MDKPKINYRFHNPNPTDEELTRVLLRICVDANRKKAENAIRECALKESVTYRVIAVDNAAVIADLEGKTLFMMPEGDYKGKTYSIPSEYIKNESRECVLELPPDFRIELREKGKITEKLTIEEFVKAVSRKTAKDYATTVYKPPSEIAKDQAKRIRAERKVSSIQNCK